MKKGRRDGTTLILAGVHQQPKDAMGKSGLVAIIGEANFTDDLTAALARASEVVAVSKIRP